MKLDRILFALILLFFIVSSYTLYVFWQNSQRKSTGIFTSNNTNEIASKSLNFISNSQQFYPGMRFPSSSISFYIEENCNNQKRTRMIDAFDILAEMTGVLKFYSAENDSADISVSCDEKEEQISEDYFVMGEGGPVRIINSTPFYIIEKGKVLLLYNHSNCNDSSIEIHELLHVFGFQHSDNPNSIMYNVSSCDQTLTSDILIQLREIYSQEALPDLYFSNIKATKHGQYLDFSAEIRNSGLVSASNVQLTISNDHEKIDDFNLGEIGYGEGKLLEVNNTKLPSRNVEYLKFVIVSELKDINEANNVAELHLE